MSIFLYVIQSVLKLCIRFFREAAHQVEDAMCLTPCGMGSSKQQHSVDFTVVAPLQFTKKARWNQGMEN